MKAISFTPWAAFVANLNVRINTNFLFSSSLILFSNYLDNPQNMRVNYSSSVSWILAKNLSLSFKTFLRYDDKVMIRNPDDIDKYPDGKQRIQLQEILGLNFSYSFPVPKK